MKKKLLLSALAVAAIPALSGCQSMGGVAEDLWNWDIRGNSAPKQASTSRVAPLVVPPDFALEPAQTGAPRAAEGASQDQVMEAMFGGAAQRSAGERAVLTAAGNADAGIRSTVGDPETATVNKGLVTRDIIAAPEGDGQNAQAAIPE